MTDQDRIARTRFAARIIGPLMLIVGVIVAIRFDVIAQLALAALQDPPLAFITGIFALIVGLVLFAAHHHWSSAAAIAVSLIALLTILRGIVLMTAPDLAADIATQLLQSQPIGWAAGGVAILIGLWLTLAGWFPKPESAS